MNKQEIIDFLESYKTFSSKRLLKEFPELIDVLTRFPDTFSIQQKLYHYIHDDLTLELGKCANCGKRCKFMSIKHGYKTYCSKGCLANSAEIIDKRRQTCIEKYGTSCSLHSTEIIEKTKKTCLKKYGTEFASQSEKIKEKTRLTNLEKYGTEYPAQTEYVKDKIKTTNLEKYGTEYAQQSKEVSDKIKKTNVERYGSECVFGSDKIKEKIKNTNLKKYGTECVLKSEDIKSKIRNTNLTKYGTEFYLQSDDKKEKTKKTCIEKYNVENPSQSEYVKSKVRKTVSEKYGMDNVSQVGSIKEKKKNTTLTHFGVEHYFQSEDLKHKRKKRSIEKYGTEYASQSEIVKDKIRNTNLEKYGVPYACMRPEARNYSNDSGPNISFAKMLDENHIDYVREFGLKNYSYDFKIGNILIEINPTITHNSCINIFGAEPKDKEYHLGKSNCAKENGYHCIHVWDWDDKSKIINMFKPKETLYARNLTLKEVSEKECDEFLNLYHLQNTCKGQKIRYGLYKDKTLVQIMTFGKPRYNKNFELELLRLCSHKDYKIVGGAEKIFKYILDKFKPESIISYCDNSKFSGEVYTRIGFSLKSKSSASKHWYNQKTNQHITDNLLRKRGFDQLFDTSYGKGTSNEELMIQYKFLPVYDCGQMTFIWLNNIFQSMPHL